MAGKAKIDFQKCKGCYYCIAVCPKKAIRKSGESNEKGYDYVEVEPDLCTGCGACYIVCPDCCITIVEENP